MKTAFIYALRCPITGQIRYVGKCDDPKTRLPAHLRDPQKNHRTNWLNILTKRGLKPSLEVVAEVPWDDWQFWERSYIRLYRCVGFDLVNSTDGGEGNFNPSAETRAKIGAYSGAARLGKKLSPGHCKNISYSQTGRKTARNTSGFVGVSWCKVTKKWRTFISVKGKLCLLGYFRKKEDAVFVRALAFDKYYGNK